MIDVAPLRECVILRLLDETWARLHEVLAMTAGGYRKGHSQLIGVRALLRNKGSLEREVKPVTFESETDYLLHRYVKLRVSHTSVWAARGWMTFKMKSRSSYRKRAQTRRATFGRRPGAVGPVAGDNVRLPAGANRAWRRAAGWRCRTGAGGGCRAS
jgi:hypothetical protein